MRQSVRCECEGWEWREVTLLTGLAAVERYCPRCKRRMLLVFRGPAFCGSVAFGGAHERPIEVALGQMGLTEHEAQMLLLVARQMAS